MMENLTEKKVAIIATNGFEEAELFEPKKALEDSGAKVFIVSPEDGKIKAWKDGNWSKELDVDVTIDKADEADYHALVIPGGVINPDKLRRNPQVVKFVRSFFENHKPVAVICHGPQLLIEADVVEGRKMTSFFSIKKDLQNAGAEWIDQEVVVDNGLVTSRNPGDLKAFNKKMLEEISEGRHK